MHKVKILFLCCTILLLAPFSAKAYRFDLSLDLAKMAMLGTLEADAGFALAKHWNLKAGLTFNPWTFHSSGKQFQHRQLFGEIGTRYWFWFTQSGWYADGSGFFGIYNHGGILDQKTYEGMAGGIRLNAGYALMLSGHVNLSFDLGLKAGCTSYTVYKCPSCGTKLGKSRHFFLSPDLGIGLDFIF